MPNPQRTSAQMDRNRVEECLLFISVSISYHSSHVSSLRYSAWSQEIRKGLSKGFTKGFRKKKFTETIGSEPVNHMSLITCHSSHVTHLMSHHYVTDLMSIISCHLSHVSISCHSSHFAISCNSSHVTHLMSHHYITHLMSHHYVADTKLLPIYSRVATFNFCHILCPLVSA